MVNNIKDNNKYCLVEHLESKLEVINGTLDRRAISKESMDSLGLDDFV